MNSKVSSGSVGGVAIGVPNVYFLQKSLSARGLHITHTSTARVQMLGPRLYRSQSLPLWLLAKDHYRFSPPAESLVKRAKTTDDVDTFPYSQSADNLVPCGFASEDEDDVTTDEWVKSTEETDGDETDLEEDQDAYMNRCVECGINMGVHNPRQYCGKTHCIYGRRNNWVMRVC